MPNATSLDPYVRLLEQSLLTWRLIARVRVEPQSVIAIDGLGRQIRIRRAEPSAPFRWIITTDGRTRPALSIITVLRLIRGALDPSFKPVRVRIAPLPIESR